MSKTSYHHGNLKQALLENAIEVLETEGLEKLSLRNVAKRTGVSQAAPYSHFKDKTALLAGVAEIGFRRLSELPDGFLEETVEPTEQLRILSHGYIRFALQNRALFQLMFGPKFEQLPDYPELQAVADQSLGIVYNVVEKILRSNPHSTIHPMIATQSAWAMMHGLANLILNGHISPECSGEKDIKSIIDKVTEPLIRGLTVC